MKIKEYREKLGLSSKELAEKMGGRLHYGFSVGKWPYLTQSGQVALAGRPLRLLYRRTVWPGALC